MKKKSWSVFKIVVYLSMAMAVFAFLFLLYAFFESGNVSRGDVELFLILILVPVVQMFFQLLNARLVQYHLPNNLVPTHSFKVWHTLLFILTTVCIFMYCVLLMQTISEIRRPAFGQSRSFNIWQQVFLASVTCTIVFNLYTLIVSLQLRSHLRFNNKAAEEQWLNNIGSGQKMD